MSIQSTVEYYSVAIFYYLVGGLTFVPLCIALFLAWFYLTAPVYRPSERVAESTSDLLGDVEFGEERKREALDLAVSNAEAQRLAEQSKDREEATGTSTAPPSARRLKPPPAAPAPRPHRSGWLVIRRQFHADNDLAAQQQATGFQETPNVTAANGAGESVSTTLTRGAEGERQPGYMSSLYRGMLNYRNSKAAEQMRRKGLESNSGSGTTTPEHGQEERGGAEKAGAGVASATAAATPSKPATGTGGRESFYCILKGPVLYLYSSDDTNNSTTECHAAIDLRSKRVSLFISGVGDTLGEPDEEEEEDRVRAAMQTTPFDTESSTTSEGEELREKRSKINWKKAKRAAVRDGELFTKRNAVRIVSTAGANRGEGKRRFAQWFVFCRSATMLEDWYHALLHASMLPETGSFDAEDPVGPVFSPIDMVNLLSSLDTLPDPIPLRWLNALVGRVFFSIYRTAWLEDYVTRKIMKKMSRVKTPGFLSDIRVQEIDLGRTPPAFSRPMLKSLTGSGEASMEVAIHYAGSIRLTISTVLTISLGSRFKPYNVPLVLAVIVNSLEGNLLLHIKPPPSNRIWFGFTKLPKMDISVEPVVSERKVQWGMVKKLIEGRIRELLTESLVVPNMDDISFFDSRPLSHRGGIWADASKRPDRTSATSAAVAGAEEATVEQTSKSLPTSVLDMPLSESEGKSAATGVSAGLGGEVKRRGKREGETSSTAAPANTSSPAAAGLSTLLARDMASETSRPASAQSGPNNKRRSWFVGRSNAASPSVPQQKQNQQGVNGRRAGQAQQSSLAWGSASFSVPSTADQAASQSAPVSAIDAPIEEDVPFGTETKSHERNKDSVSSFDTSAGSSVASADTEELHSGLLAALGGQEERGEDELKTRMGDGNEVPSLNVESSSSNDSEQTQGILAPGEQDADFSAPVSLSPDQQSINEEAGLPASDDSKQAEAAVVPTTIHRTPSHGFAPPPSRGATIRQQQQKNLQPSLQPDGLEVQHSTSPLSSATAHLSALQRDRYIPSVRGRDDDTASMRSANTSSAALLNTWNKAKASMADKDSRQTAARDAKDALRRGWASWNAKRNNGMQGDEQFDQLPTSSDRMGESSMSTASRDGRGSGKWLASSPPDPASLAIGFDVPARRSNEGRSGEMGQRTSELGTDRLDGRAPYRDYRASKERNSSQPASKPSSIRSGISTPPTSAAAWDADVPSIAAPLPIARRDVSNGSLTGPPRDYHSPANLSTSPSSIRKLSQGQRGGGTMMGGAEDESSGASLSNYSFVPSQGQATTSLSRTDLGSEMTDEDRSDAKGALGDAKGGVGEEAPPPEQPGATDSAMEESSTSSPPSHFIGAIPAMTTTEEPANGSAASEQDRQVSSSSNNPSLGPARLTASGIKQQPTRAPMMAVPGIPSMQKTSPQSFSATPEPASSTAGQQTGERTSLGPTSSPRLGLGNLLPRMPSFASSSAATSPGIPAPATQEAQEQEAPKRRLPPSPPSLGPSSPSASVGEADGTNVEEQNRDGN